MACGFCGNHSVALRVIPIRQAGARVTTFMGGDRTLVMLAGLFAVAITVPAFTELKAWVGGVGLWVGALFVFRLMAKSDVQMREVGLRHLRYARYYPARATPFRVNKNSDGKRNRGPGEKK